MGVLRPLLSTSNIYILNLELGQDELATKIKLMEKSYNTGLLVATGIGDGRGLAVPPQPHLDFVKFLYKIL